MTLEPLDLLQHAFRDGDAVGGGFLGHRDRDGGRAVQVRCLAIGDGVVRGAAVILDDLVGAGGLERDPGDVADVDRHAVSGADHQALHVVGGFQERAGLELEGGAAGLHVAHLAFRVGRRDGLGNLTGADGIAREPLGQDLDADLFGAAADNEALASLRHFLQALQHVEGDLTQHCVVQFLGPQRQRHHRHVVDALRLDQRLRYAGRNLVHVGHQLVVELDQRGLHLLADFELHRDHALAALRGGVDVLDPRDLAHHPL